MNYMTSATEIGKRMRGCRKSCGLTQAEVAERMDLSINYVSDLENGKKNMPSEWIIKLADLYTLSDEQKKDLDAAVAESEKGIGVKFAGLSADERKLSVAFARKIKSLSASEQTQLERILL